MLGEANRWDSGEGRGGHGGFIVFGTYFVCRCRALAVPHWSIGGNGHARGLAHFFQFPRDWEAQAYGSHQNPMFAD